MIIFLLIAAERCRVQVPLMYAQLREKVPECRIMLMLSGVEPKTREKLVEACPGALWSQHPAAFVSEHLEWLAHQDFPFIHVQCDQTSGSRELLLNCWELLQTTPLCFPGETSCWWTGVQTNGRRYYPRHGGTLGINPAKLRTALGSQPWFIQPSPEEMQSKLAAISGHSVELISPECFDYLTWATLACELKGSPCGGSPFPDDDEYAHIGCGSYAPWSLKFNGPEAIYTNAGQWWRLALDYACPDCWAGLANHPWQDVTPEILQHGLGLLADRPDKIDCLRKMFTVLARWLHPQRVETLLELLTAQPSLPAAR